jgi:hypothetical protein
MVATQYSAQLLQPVVVAAPQRVPRQKQVDLPVVPVAAVPVVPVAVVPVVPELLVKEITAVPLQRSPVAVAAEPVLLAVLLLIIRAVPVATVKYFT